MLKNYVAVYVPTRRHNGTRIANESIAPWMDVVVKTMIEQFGGCTIIQGFGHFANPLGTVCQEEVSIVYSYCDDNHLREGRVAIYDLARNLCHSMVQSTVAIVMDGGMQLIKA